MLTLEDQLSKACAAIGLQIDIGHVADIGGGKTIHSVARIRNLGNIDGMLVFRDLDEIGSYCDEFIDAGYGISVLSDPISDQDYSLTGCIEMFRDWGWAGSPESTPPSLR